LFTENHYWAGRRCQKALYLLAREAPATSFAVWDVAEQRRLLRLAAPLLPGPIMVIAGDIETRLRQTQQCLKAGQAMLEAVLAHDGWLAEVDYLGPHPHGGWQIFSVIPQITVSPITRQRLAYQARIVKAAGVDLVQVGLVTLNPIYCRAQRLDPSSLFLIEPNIQVGSHDVRELDEALDAYAQALRASAPASIPLGPYCEEGGDCPFKARCWGGQLPEHNIFHLYQLSRQKAFKLYKAGHVSLQLLPKNLRTQNREAQLYAVQTGRPYVDRPALREFLGRLEYPLHCLDFETVNAAIPWLPGLQPFHQVPVQFSITRVRAPGAELEHETFVCTGQSDPRTPMLDRLKSSLGRRGSILAYNAAFEQSVLESLVRWDPVRERWYDSLRPRWVDMLEPFKNFYCYFAQQKGSCSLKEVLPAVTGRGYEDLAIRDGHQATQAWLRLLFDRLSAEEAAKVRQDLMAYCRRDTDALAWLVQALRAWV
jgi:hypothetical protein